MADKTSGVILVRLFVNLSVSLCSSLHVNTGYGVKALCAWLIEAVVYLRAAPRVQLFVKERLLVK